MFTYGYDCYLGGISTFVILFIAYTIKVSLAYLGYGYYPWGFYTLHIGWLTDSLFDPDRLSVAYII
jgi:hypothetical protein